MNTTSRIVIVAIALYSLSAHAQRQTKLYIDDNTGHFSILQATNGGGGGTITFPAGNGTLVTSSISSPSAGTLLYASGSGGWTPLSPGTNSYVLTLNGSGLPVWSPEAGFTLPYSQSVAPGAATAGFAITNLSNSGYAIEGIDNASSGGIGLYGLTSTGNAGVLGSSAGAGPGLYGSNSGTTGPALATYTFLGNSQPNISITNYGHGPDIEGTSDLWQVDKSGNGTFATLFVAPTGSQSGIAINNTGNFLDIEGNNWGVDGAGDIYAYGIITAELNNDAGYVNMDPTGTYSGLINCFSQGHPGSLDINGTNSTWSVDYLGNGEFNTFTINTTGSAAGITMNNSGTGNDITGSEVNWKVAKTGAAVFTELTTGVHTDVSGHYSFDATGTPDFTVIETHTGQSPFPYVTLPPVSAGRIVVVKYDDPTPSHVCIVYPNTAGPQIDGLNEYDMSGFNGSNPSGITLVSDGHNWFVIGSH